MNARLYVRHTHRAVGLHRTVVIVGIAMTVALVGLLSLSSRAVASPGSGSESEDATLNNWTNLYPDLQRVSAVSGSEAWAAGSYGELLHYTGGAWTSVDVPAMQGIYPYDINMRSATDGWVAAGYRAFQYDGTNWVEKSNGLGYNVASVYGIAPVAPNDAWGVAWTPGGYGFVHWNGTQWTPAGPILPSSSYMNAISISSANEGWAIGQVYVSSYWQGTMYHYDGVSWQQVSNPAGIAPLRGIWTSPTMPGEAWATGGDSTHAGTVYHYSSGAWSSRTTPSNTVPGSIFMLSPNEGWATIIQSVSGILHWNGTSWTLEYTSNFYLRSIAGGPGMTWAVGNGGTIVSRPGAGTWTRQRGAPTFNNLNAVHALNANDAWAVGAYNTALHYDGNSWQQVPALLDSSFYDVQMLSANDVYAVGSNAIAHWDGASWTRVALPPNTLRGIAMTSPGEGWAVGDSGSIWHSSGGQWSAVSTGITRTLTAIAMDSPTHGWAVGGDLSQVYSSIPALIEYTGGAWVDRSATLPANVGNLEDIVLAPGGNEGWAVGHRLGNNERPVVHLLNGVWSLEPYEPPSFLNSVDMLSPDDVWAVGSPTLRRTNGLWNQISLPTTSTPNGVSLVPGFGGWAVGPYGTILRYDLPAVGGTPTSTASPASPTPTATGIINCNAQVVNSVAYCSLPDTYNYDFTVFSSCGNNATGNVFFVVGPNASGPWTTLSTLPFQQIFSPGNNTIQGNVSAVVPAQYSWYRFELDGRLGTGQGFGGPTASHPVCGLSTTTPTSIPTSTPTVTPTATIACAGNSPDCTTSTPTSTTCCNSVTATIASSCDGNSYRYTYGLTNSCQQAVTASGALWMEASENENGPWTSLVVADMFSVTFQTGYTEDSGPLWNGPLPNGYNWFRMHLHLNGTGSSSCWTIDVASTPRLACVQGNPTPTRTSTGTPVPPTATSVPSATPTVCAMTFTDVPSTNSFYQFVNCLACHSIISGYPCGGDGEPCDEDDNPYFRPYSDVTRGQIAKIVSNSAGFNEDAGEQIYEDVPAINPFYVWVNRLSRRGYMSGYPCGTVPEEPCGIDSKPYFRPGNSATRGQLAKIVSNSAGYEDTPPDQLFTDIAPDHPFYIWVQRLASRGFIGGYPCGGPGELCDGQNRPYFRAYNNVTRGQTSKIVANTFFPECQSPLASGK